MGSAIYKTVLGSAVLLMTSYLRASLCGAISCSSGEDLPQTTISRSFYYSSMPGDFRGCVYRVVPSLSVVQCGMKSTSAKANVFRYDAISRQCFFCTAEDMKSFDVEAEGRVWVKHCFEQATKETTTATTQSTRSGGFGLRIGGR